MPVWLELLLVAAALYLAECLVWCRRGDVVFAESKKWWRRSDEPHVEIRSRGGFTPGSLLPARAVVRCRRALHHREAFNTAAASKRLREARVALGRVRFLSSVLFVFVFAAVPLLLWKISLAASWPAFAAVAAGLMLVIATEAAWADRVLYPKRSGRFERVLPLVLSPISAMKAAQHLSLDLFDDYHPIAVSFVLCDEDTFGAVARQALFDAAFARSSDETRAIGVEVDALLRRTGRRNRVMAAPAAEDDCRGFCPRCHGQYVDTSALCADCGVSLVTFGAGVAPARG
jgi:hypothetical protein